MTSKNNKKSPDAAGKGEAKGNGGKEPGWANGLRQLYDSVVEEELPDSFKDLLSKLDAPGK